MTAEMKQLVDQTVELTGAAPPAVLDADAPVLADDEIAPDARRPIYLIGLIGGKDVGKSSLVNALVGRQISQVASHGPGTEKVMAYAHVSAAEALGQVLQREVPQRFQIVTHDIARLSQQVLLDLPDIDSHYDDHIAVTRRMLRHMLYPVWVQSVEKYADQRPQQLLVAVAEGNDPANFVFCLNKADQLASRGGPQACAELRDDYAGRIQRALRLPAPPGVFVVSATRPQDHDLSELKRLLSHPRSGDEVDESRDLAARRRDRTLLNWIEQQQLGERAARLARLEREAEELLAARLAAPLLQRAVQKMLDDPSRRMALVAPATRIRLWRWPIVAAIDALLAPVLSLVQKNLSTPTEEPEVNTAAAVQGAFAQLHQTSPQIAELYRDRRLWESMPADAAAADLRRRFAAVLNRQEAEVMRRATGRMAVILAPWRWLLTIGAVLWFPFVQPLLHAMLQQDSWHITKETLRLVVSMLGVTHLLRNVTFLVMWFAILWLWLRWSTQRKVYRMIQRWKLLDESDLSLSAAVLDWADEMIEPLRQQREKVESVASRAKELAAQR